MEGHKAYECVFFFEKEGGEECTIVKRKEHLETRKKNTLLDSYGLPYDTVRSSKGLCGCRI